MKYKWINTFTGEVFENLFQAIRTTLLDMVHYEKCRDVRMLRIARL